MNGRLLKSQQKVKNIKSEALAVMLGVSLSTVTNMRAGKDVEDTTREKAEDVLGLSRGALGTSADHEALVSPTSAKAASR